MAAIIFTLLALLGSSQPNIKIENVWIRPAAKGMNSAMYFKAVNNSDKPDTLYKAASSLAELVQIHETFKKNGMMGMHEVPFVVVKAHSSIVFKPGGYHVMFIKLKKNLKVKTKAEAFLFFRRTGKIKVNPVVKLQ